MEGLLFLATVTLFIWVWSLQKKVKALQDQTHTHTSKADNTVPKTSETPAASPKSEINLPWEKGDRVTAKTTKSSKVVKKSEFQLEDFLGRKFFAILGTLSIILAVGFFTMWAFANGYIGPRGQIGVGAIFGLGLLALGEFIRGKHPKFAPFITAGGVTSLIIVTFVARYHYEFISATSSLVLYSLEVATGVILALRYNSRLLANFAIAGGLIAPLLTNSSEPNAVGLLGFLTILAAGGFVVAAHKQWIEILALLALGIIGFETGIVVTQNKDLIDPLLLLGFIYVLHLLLGSGGLVRLIKTKANQSISKLSGVDGLEALLFSGSLLVANILAYAVFDHEGWSHFGFFVLAQGLGLYGLSEYFKSQKWELLFKITLGATLTSILFATFWEMKAESDFMMIFVLALEGILMVMAARWTNENVFAYFGRGALVLAFIFSQEFRSSFLWETLAASILIGALGFSLEAKKLLSHKVWAITAVILSTIVIIEWSHELNDILNSPLLEFVTLIPGCIWAAGLAYSVLKTKSEISRMLGLGILVFMNFIVWSVTLNGDGNAISKALSLLLILATNFIVLASFFLEGKDLPQNPKTQNWVIYTILGLASISVFLFGAENTQEPARTILWLLWGVSLLATGMVQNWIKFRYMGLGVILFVIAKLYLVDIWQLEAWVRFLAFFALGIVLLSTAFYYQKRTK